MNIREEIRKIVIQELSALARAEDLAMDVHSGQTRRSSGLPYYTHPYRVYQRVKQLGLSKEHQLIALLHDTFEDSKHPKKVIEKIRSVFGDKIAKIILLLSHEKGTDYTEYLLNLAKKNTIALDVKLVDMENNLIDKPTEKQRQKYKNALLQLFNNRVNINPKLQKSLFQKAGIKNEDLS